MKKYQINVNIIGSNYTINFLTKKLYLRGEEVDGICNYFDKLIEISLDNDINYNKLLITVRLKEQIKHEVIHAFIKECGLDENGYSERWCGDEECVQFFASQFDKLLAIFNECYAKIEKLIEKESSNV